MEKQIVTRPFEPEIPLDFLLCIAQDARNTHTHLVSEFAKETKAVAMRLIDELKGSWS
ncbi:hypothetical protein ABNQ38_03650 [Azospirillum sp. A29]|uniref:hypothetical protein n=1 Tax=Azospirillum sp. A29 TaxID=3160606 RepID=UPI00366B45DD